MGLVENHQLVHHILISVTTIHPTNHQLIWRIYHESTQASWWQLKHFFMFTPNLGEDSHPIWLAHIFQLGWNSTTNQPRVFLIPSKAAVSFAFHGGDDQAGSFAWRFVAMWVFPTIGVGPQNGWWKEWKTLLKWDDLGVLLFSETSIYNPKTTKCVCFFFPTDYID